MTFPGSARATTKMSPRHDFCPAGRLQSETLSGVVAEDVAVADVAAERGGGLVAGLVHDGAFGFAGDGGRSGQAGAEAVAGKLPGLVADGGINCRF